LADVELYVALGSYGAGGFLYGEYKTQIGRAIELETHPVFDQGRDAFTAR